jgi:hypothetical protein
MSPSCSLRRSSHSAKFLLEKKTLQGMCLFRASVSAGREECFHYPVKRDRGSRDTHGTHTGHAGTQGHTDHTDEPHNIHYPVWNEIQILTSSGMDLVG